MRRKLQDRRRPQVRRRPARTGRRPGRAERSSAASTSASTLKLGNQAVDRGRHVRLRRFARFGTVGATPRRWPRPTTASAFQSVTVEAGRQGRLQAAEGRAGRRSAPEARRADHARLLQPSSPNSLTKLISILGTVIGTIMAIGAVFGALNTMYAAVAGRAREIATMRAIGFRGLPVVMAVMLETMLLALLGGLLGGADRLADLQRLHASARWAATSARWCSSSRSRRSCCGPA